MNPFTFLGTFAFATFFYLGLFVLSLDTRSKVNRLFSSICLCFTVWTFGSLMKTWASTEEAARFWQHAAALGWIFFIPFMLQFFLTLTQREAWFKKPWVLVSIYLPAPLFFARSLHGPLVIEGVFRGPWGWDDLLATNSPWLWIFMGYCLATVAFCMALVWEWGFKSHDPLKKKQAWYLFWGILPPGLAIVALKSVLPALLGYNMVPAVSSSVVLLFWALPNWYAISRYRLLNLTPEMAAEKIIEIMPDALVLVDSRGKIQLANASLHGLLGFRPGELHGRGFAFLTGDAKDEVNLLKEGGEKRVELKFWRKSGDRVPVRFYSSRLADEKGRVLGFVGIAHDLRDIQVLQDRLIQADKIAAVGQLAGGIAHEVNNPVGVILGFAQALSKKIGLEPIDQAALASIEREALRCKVLVEELLTFSRRSPGMPVEMELAPLLRETLLLVEPRARDQNITLSRVLSDQGAWVKGDKNRLQQVLLNLCNNALDYTPRGGQVTVATSVRGGEVVIEVRDNGLGMNEEVKRHLFEPFFTTKEVGKGMGLSLSLCYEILRAHGGSIEVQSQPGMGSVFSVRLPSTPATLPLPLQEPDPK